MLKKIFFAVTALFMAAAVTPAEAGISFYTAPQGSPGGVRAVVKTIFSLGIQWDFGDKKPEIVAAVRRTQTDAQSRVTGGKVDLTMPLALDMNFAPKLRVLGVAGDRNIQAEAGFGLRLTPHSISPLIAGGVQLPYVNGGANYIFADGLKPYLGFNTIRRAVAPTRTPDTISCSSGVLQDATYLVNPGFVVGGKTCYHSY